MQNVPDRVVSCGMQRNTRLMELESSRPVAVRTLAHFARRNLADKLRKPGAGQAVTALLGGWDEVRARAHGAPVVLAQAYSNPFFPCCGASRAEQNCQALYKAARSVFYSRSAVVCWLYGDANHMLRHSMCRERRLCPRFGGGSRCVFYGCAPVPI